ncbi:hypothetical protein N9X15_02300 [Flavobacteriaceae bacterium]|nr:hypothetical protein [Flavobacteriaceae bacterium]
MNPMLESAGSIFGSIFILVAAFGAIKRIRGLFLFGICFFGTSPIIAEGIGYAQDNNIVHLFIIVMFLGQVILTLPTNTPFDEKNKAAMAMINRIGCVILVINLFQGYLILSKSLDLPQQFGFMHLVVALIMIYTVLRPEKDKIWT